MVGLKTLIDQKLQERKPELTPLEISILQESGAPVPPVNADAQQAEEMAAVFDIFQSSLMDIAPVPVDRYYAVAMLAAEMANVDNEVRRELLTMTNGVERMRIVLQEIEEAISMNQARTVAGSITDELDEDDKDLKVRSIVRIWKREKHSPCRYIALRDFVAFPGGRTAIASVDQGYQGWHSTRILLE
jgi:predicted DNA-binding protein YlxM (UPF0122 family)